MKYYSPKDIYETIVLLNGEFPKTKEALSIIDAWIDGKGLLISCDGATNKLANYTDKMPDFVVGDLDSISEELKAKLSTRIKRFPSQDIKDFTKAINFAKEELNISKITVLGISGGREDHSLENLALMNSFLGQLDEIVAVTDTGQIRIVSGECKISTYEGQQVSFFSFAPQVFSAKGVRWELDNYQSKALWGTSLNEAIDKEIYLNTETNLMVYTLSDRKDK